MGLISDNGPEERILLNDLDDLFGHAERLRTIVVGIDAEKTESEEDKGSEDHL